MDQHKYAKYKRKYNDLNNRKQNRQNRSNQWGGNGNRSSIDYLHFPLGKY